ncbi:MAG: alpha/beta hydrolase [Rhabdochlamydiaceae bacterium]|nr:alpha/beta hydrolase [Rhabdochlamydiaceae bacterium]
MHKPPLKTRSGARLQWLGETGQSDLHWLFLPGGPGLGSESLILLCNLLRLPGTSWRVDLPGDGANTTPNDYISFSHWPSALIEAVSQFKRVVLVAHSTGGMYVLSLPELEGLLQGLILLDSAPNAQWQASFEKRVHDFPIEGLDVLLEKHNHSPSNESLKRLTVASAPYLFTDKGMEKGILMLESLAYNQDACRWSQEHFDSTYEAKWIPQTIPTLILAGERDQITPLSLFAEALEFQRANIKIESIKDAGHFPWIDNPKDVAERIMQYCSWVDGSGQADGGTR